VNSRRRRAAHAGRPGSARRANLAGSARAQASAQAPAANQGARRPRTGKHERCRGAHEAEEGPGAVADPLLALQQLPVDALHRDCASTGPGTGGAAGSRC